MVFITTLNKLQKTNLFKLSKMGDEYQYELSNRVQGGDLCPYVSKSYAVITDDAPGSYGSNVLRYSLSQLFNSAKTVNMREAVIEIPLLLTATCPGGFQVNKSDFVLGLKNGYHNLINSFTIQYDGKTVSEQCQNSTFYTSFKMLQTTSETDKVPKSKLKGFVKDESGWGFTDVNNIGLTNNRISDTYDNQPSTGGYGVRTNAGLYTRQKQQNYNAAVLGRDAIVSDATLQQQASSRVVYGGVVGAVADSVCIYMVATIKLADISDFFAQFPLCKNVFGTLEINLNMGSTVIAMAAQAYAANSFTPTATSRQLSIVSSSFPFRTCPVMVTPPHPYAAAGITALLGGTAVIGDIAQNIAQATRSSGWYPATDAAVNITCTLSVCTQAGFTAHRISSTRLLVPMIQMQPEFESNYFENSRKKVIEYDELKYVSFSNIASQGNIQNLILSNVLSPVGLLIVPMLSRTANKGWLPTESALTAEPATCSPVVISQFNCSVGGMLLYPRDFAYGFEQFQQELSAALTTNGGHSDGMASGLISSEDFTHGVYRYMYCNLERRFADSKSPVSISIQGINSAAVACDLHCFVVCRRQVLLDVYTGKLTSNTDL